MDALDHAVTLGRFADTLTVLKHRATTLDQNTRAVLTAEALERLGNAAEASRLARGVIDRVPEGALRARSLSVLGLIALEAGDSEAAIGYLNQSMALASAAKSSVDVCWAKLRLLIALAEAAPPNALAAHLTDLRRTVSRLGDPIAAITLHIFVAEIESQRGAIESARRHGRVALSLLRTHPNHWLEGLAHVNDACIAYMCADATLARAHGQRALISAMESGHFKSKLAAISNLAHIDLTEGKLDSAEVGLNRALKMARHSPRAEVGVLDGLAQLELTRGRFREAEVILERIAESRLDDRSYGKRWGRVTYARLLSRTDRWKEASEVVTQVLENAGTVGDTHLATFSRLLRSEIRAVLGDAAGSGTDLTDALRGYQEPSLEILAESQRVLGRALAREGDRTGSRVAFERSQRILGAIGHIRAHREVAAQAAEEAKHPVPSDAAASGAATTDSDGAPRPDLLMGRLVAALQQASRPDLLGAELLDVLIDTGTTQRAAIVVSRGSGAISVDRRLGWTADEALAAAANPSSPPLSLGTWRDASWQLVVDVPSSVAAQSAWLAVHTLAVSGLELAKARRDAREREALWPIADPDEPSPGVFGSEQMSELLRITRRIATTHVTVLITGETGAGKEVLAHVLHDASSRAGKPFVPLNCSAVPRDMLEDQLFGHRRGAFTGAEAAFPGVIRAAEGGTVFLDEIGEVGIDLQPKLLRFLESSEVHPLGEPHPIRVDVRVVAATNQDLEQLVRDGRFREDLYYRLNVIRLHVPPLRERREEIPLLVSHFLERFARESQKGRLRVAEETMEYLVLYAWPGNVRQLANELRRVVAFAEHDAILMPEHLSAEIVASRRTRPASERDLLPTELVVRIDQPLAAATEHVERALIQHAMTLCHGRLEEAAAMLGLSRKGLYLKRQRLGIGTPAA